MSDPINKAVSGKILGVDESGKGDFFGPLVIAGVLADAGGAQKLLSQGVRDSKKLSDNRVTELSRWIMANYVHGVVVIGPEKYNQLYSKIKNLNRLLAWGHSRVIENVATQGPIDLAISDKFGRDDFIEKALMEKGRRLVLRQEVRAEEIPQVAAASVLARAGFLEYMAKMSRLYDMELPKGAGEIVDRAAAEFVKRHGIESLARVAKLHFKNYKKVVG